MRESRLKYLDRQRKITDAPIIRVENIIIDGKSSRYLVFFYLVFFILSLFHKQVLNESKKLLVAIFFDKVIVYLLLFLLKILIITVMNEIY